MSFFEDFPLTVIWLFKNVILYTLLNNDSRVLLKFNKEIIDFDQSITN